MGVKTPITLKEAQVLFPSYSLISLTPTQDGVIDTTYILDEFILKHYERDIEQKIQADKKLLTLLKKTGLNVPLCVAQNGTWFLYEKLHGKEIKNTQLFHIQSLARFMAKMHRTTHQYHSKQIFLQQYDLNASLKSIKSDFYFYYKKLLSLRNYKQKNDGFIHGDIFKDNTLFDKEKIAVFDFIDGGNGSFIFDVAVALLAFNPSKRQLYTNVFLNTYNQTAPFKITLSKLHEEVSCGAKLYSLLRILTHKNTKEAKKLARFW